MSGGPSTNSRCNLEDLEAWFQDERVGDHRIVWLIRELLDVEVLLDGPIRIRQERPRGTEGIAELIDVQLIVGRDDNQSRVCVSKVGIGIDQVPQKPMLLRIKASPRQMEHHRIAPLQPRERSPFAGLIGQLIVGERPAFTYVAAHVASSLVEGSKEDPTQPDFAAIRQRSW